MAFRALLFSKNEETNAALVSACAKAGLYLEVCEDIFGAIDKGTKQPFSCVLVDWAGQPEAGFLLKRSRESGPNKSPVAIAIVDHDPSAAEMRDHRLDFLIHRPIAADETCDLLTKASEKMQQVSAEDFADSPAGNHSHNPASRPVADESPEPPQDQYQQDAAVSAEPRGSAENLHVETEVTEEEPRPRLHNSVIALRNVFAAMLVLTAALSLGRARDSIVYLARTPEGRINVLRESVAALFYLNPSGAQAVGAASADAQQDAYFSRAGTNSAPQTPQIGVVPTEADLSETPMQLRKAADIPLPTPVYERPEPEPVHQRSAAIPESLRSSAPIAPPVVVTVNPAQMMPVSAPSIPPVSTQTINEPVSLSEEAARALLIQSVNPSYPPEALPQKLQGTVVLQATIGRDGSVEDLKIVRGYFVLGKSAIAAVKQWRFQPYTLNGHAAQTQTTITVRFTYPPS
jgi:TonB family protein